MNSGRLNDNLNFYGRDSEFADFKQLIDRKQGTLVTCQGRRRIGKSTFITQCGELTTYFYNLVGAPPRNGITREDQLATFAKELNREFGAPDTPMESWHKAFQLLATALPKDGTVVVLLDEISWMSIGDPDFAGALKTAWDLEFSLRPGLVLVLCGSVSSWIEENILNSTGFVGRVSWQFHLKPLPLHLCNEFWVDREKSRAKETPVRDKLRVLAVAGGVPRYLKEIKANLSSEQNIQRLCFNKGGLLYREFDQIFSEIFMKRADTYKKVVRALVDGPRTAVEIGGALGRESGGTLSKALSDLEGAGFIEEDRSFNPSTAKDLARTAQYRLSDNYLRFYLKYVEPKKDRIEKGLYDRVPIESLEAWDAIMGLQFENLIHNSRGELLVLLGLGKTAVLNVGPYFQRATQRKKACQVDLLIRTASALYIVEVKARLHVRMEAVEEVKEKVKRLKLPRELPVRTVLVYSGGLDPAVPRSDFFDHIVNFEELLFFNGRWAKRRRRK